MSVAHICDPPIQAEAKHALRISATSQPCQDERDDTSHQLSQCRDQLAELREQYDKHLLEMQAQAKTQQATAHEERLREKALLKDQHERWV